MVKRRKKAHRKRARRKIKKKAGPFPVGFRDVFIEHRSFKTLITSAIEVYNRETNGALLGRHAVHNIKGRGIKVISIKEVYPFQMEERKPSQVEHGNVAAFKRFLRATESLRTEIIGGFHSHTYPYDTIRLSKGDLDSIKEDMEAMERIGQERVKKGWLEILVSITRKKYVKSRDPSWYICDYIKKLRVRVRTRKKIGYDILISAYWIYPKGGSLEKPIGETEFRVKEVGVYVPWIMG